MNFKPRPPYKIRRSKIHPGTYAIFKRITLSGQDSLNLIEYRFPTINDAMNYLIGRGLITPCGLGSTALGSH
jgi:hypothetical protein